MKNSAHFPTQNQHRNSEKSLEILANLNLNNPALSVHSTKHYTRKYMSMLWAAQWPCIENSVLLTFLHSCLSHRVFIVGKCIWENPSCVLKRQSLDAIGTQVKTDKVPWGDQCWNIFIVQLYNELEVIAFTQNAPFLTINTVLKTVFIVFHCMTTQFFVTSLVPQIKVYRFLKAAVKILNPA